MESWWTTVLLSPNPSQQGAFKGRKADGDSGRGGVGREGGGRENNGRERWIVGPKIPLVLSLLRGSPGPTTAGPSPGNQAEQEGASQYWPGGGGEPS